MVDVFLVEEQWVLFMEKFGRGGGASDGKAIRQKKVGKPLEGPHAAGTIQQARTEWGESGLLMIVCYVAAGSEHLAASSGKLLGTMYYVPGGLEHGLPYTCTSNDLLGLSPTLADHARMGWHGASGHFPLSAAPKAKHCKDEGGVR